MSDKFAEKIKTHILYSVTFSTIVPFYEITWKNIVQLSRPQMTIWRKRIACWIPENTNTHSEYVIFIALPLQQWLHERASMLRHTYIASFFPVFLLLLQFQFNLFEFYTPLDETLIISTNNGAVLTAIWQSLY